MTAPADGPHPFVNGAPSVNGGPALNGPALNRWAAPDGSAGDVLWRRPAGRDVAAGRDGSAGDPARVPSQPVPPRYAGPPPMHRPSEAVGWGPVISPGPVPRALPHQDHDALDREDAQSRAVTVGVGVLTLVVLFLLLLMLVIRAGTATP